MIIKSKSNRTYAIVGLPRSGTSCLRRIMDSPTNSLCLNEAIYWTSINYLNKPYNYDNLSFKKPNDIFIKLREIVDSNNKYALCGDKETYRIHDNQKVSIDYIFNSDIDFLLFIIREPKSCFSSWKKSKFSKKYLDVKLFIKTYKSFYHDLLSYNKQSFLISYEDMCETNSLNYLNDKFEDYLNIGGPLTLTKKSYTGFHPERDMKKIRIANRTLLNLTIAKKNLIDDNLTEDYKHLLKLSKS